MLPDKKTLVIETNQLRLRPVLPQDVSDTYVHALNDPEINRFLEVRASPQTHQSVLQFVQHEIDSPVDILFGMFKKDSNELVGTLRLHDMSFYHFFANIGIALFTKESFGKGYALESVQAVCQWAFEKLGLHYIEAGCYQDNISSTILFMKAGFEVKSTETDRYRHGNQFTKMIWLALINPHFELERLI